MSEAMIGWLLTVLVVLGPSALARGEDGNSREEAPATSPNAATTNQGSEASGGDGGISAALFGQADQSDFTANSQDDLAQAIDFTTLNTGILANTNHKASEPTLNPPAGQKQPVTYSPQRKRNAALLIILILSLGRQHY